MRTRKHGSCMPVGSSVQANTRVVINRVAACVFVLLCSGTVAAQTRPPVMVDIAPCMAITDAAERYACYDNLAPSVPGITAVEQIATEPAQPAIAPRPAAAPVVESPAPREEVTTSVEEFGREAPAKTEPAQVVADENGNEELRDVIADLRQREPNRWLITLQSGQVWYQSNSERFRLVKGMAVRIYPSPLRGSYRLARDDGRETGFIQVQRMQ